MNLCEDRILWLRSHSKHILSSAIYFSISQMFSLLDIIGINTSQHVTSGHWRPICCHYCPVTKRQRVFLEIQWLLLDTSRSSIDFNAQHFHLTTSAKIITFYWFQESFCSGILLIILYYYYLVYSSHSIRTYLCQKIIFLDRQLEYINDKSFYPLFLEVGVTLNNIIFPLILGPFITVKINGKNFERI